jgi:hypothetical protein
MSEGLVGCLKLNLRGMRLGGIQLQAYQQPTRDTTSPSTVGLRDVVEID